MAKDRGTKKRRDPPGTADVTPCFNGTSDVPTWARWPHPRPDTYYGAPYNAYDWPHAWPSPHVRGDSTFPTDFTGGYPPQAPPPPPPPPRAPLVPQYPTSMQPTGGAASQPAVTGTSPRSSNPESQSEGSSFSDVAEEANGDNKQVRRRKSSEKSLTKPDVLKTNGNKDAKGKQSTTGDENTAKNKRYGIEEVKDLVRFRTELQTKFETMSTHLELWTSIGEKMSERGHPRRQWESYRDKWDIELRRYQKELKVLLSQAGVVDNKELEPEQLVFTDDTLQEIHNRLNSRPKAALRSRFQSGVGGARGCLGEETAREVAGKRMKKAANNQLLVDTIVDKVVEKMGAFDDTASAQGFKEVLDAVVNLTNVILADVNPQPVPFTDYEMDDKVFGWLKSIGKEQYASHFAAAHVDWTNLLLLDKEDLAEMKIPVGPRKFVLRELDKLRPMPMSAAEVVLLEQNQSQSMTEQDSGPVTV